MVSLEEMIKKEAEGTPETKKKDKKTSTDEGLLERIWNTPTGKKPVAEYNSHALNWDKKPSTGKIIRGLEGMMGGLDKAVIDFSVGIFQKVAEFVKGLGDKEE